MRVARILTHPMNETTVRNSCRFGHTEAALHHRRANQSRQQYFRFIHSHVCREENSLTRKQTHTRALSISSLDNFGFVDSLFSNVFPRFFRMSNNISFYSLRINCVCMSRSFCLRTFGGVCVRSNHVRSLSLCRIFI